MIKIAVTGATGIVGKALIRRLAQEAGVRTIGISRRKMTDPGLSSYCEWAVSDYTPGSLAEIFEGASAVVHLAGMKAVSSELADFEPDMQMTANVLSAMTAAGVPRIIYASSRLVYGNPDTVPWTEESKLEPRIAYADNKIRCEKLCAEWAADNDAEAVILRIAQLLSASDNTKNMMSVFIDTARRDGVINVIGKSVKRRQFIYDKDLAEMIVRLALKDKTGTVTVNAGMPGAFTNLEVAEAVCSAFHCSQPVRYNDSEPEKNADSYMDVGKMTELTGYVPRDVRQAFEDMYEDLR